MPDPKAGQSHGKDQPFDVGRFQDRLHAQILTREAEALLKKAGADLPPEK
jgi:hypothetical protein